MDQMEKMDKMEKMVKMDIDKFKDPISVTQIIEKIKTIPNLREIIILLNEYYPNFIKIICDDYSDDYPTLQYNWKYICNKCN